MPLIMRRRIAALMRIAPPPLVKLRQPVKVVKPWSSRKNRNRSGRIITIMMMTMIASTIKKKKDIRKH